MSDNRIVSLDQSLAKIDREIAKLEQRAEPIRAKLAPLEQELQQLRKSRKAKEVGSSGGRAPRRSKHDLEAAFRTYDEWGGRGALKHTAEKHGIPIRTLSFALVRRRMVVNPGHDMAM